MERKIIGAAQTGDVDLLHNLLKVDPQILDVLALTTSDTLLHIACVGGHLNFVQEMVKLKPSWTNELNHHGFSPLDIASADGYVEIVTELLNFDTNLCMVRGRGGEIPLHFVVARGRVKVMKEILAAEVDSVLCKNARGETCLHLAVKNHQFEGFKVLVDHIKKFNMDAIMNEMDSKGDTFMHLVASKKQYETSTTKL
ncbi:homeodomain transcription factor [Lithospermum erythrorhizon]|uniref:Homeodomain transcription factor n=1 Tax=Lithospermum erythrorhizon TaxID=34254 RepID=A0AAV3S3E4_LITER